MGIRLATFQQHQLTAQDYALLCAKSVSSGIFYGCNVTIKDESTLHVTSGVGIANGRTFDVTDDDYPVELTGGGSMVGRIYVHVDLADVDTPAQILVVKGATLPALVQDSDMNESTGVWDLELATFDVDASEISNLVYTASGVSGGGGGAMLAPYYDASEAWLKDQIFQKDGVLYKCLTDIAVGTPLVVDTNVKVTDFAEETEALNQNLTSRYNRQTDMVQLYDGTQWVDWKKAFLQSLVFFNVDKNYNTQDFGTIEFVTQGGTTITSKHFTPYEEYMELYIAYTGPQDYAGQSTAYVTYESSNYVDLSKYDKLVFDATRTLSGFNVTEGTLKIDLVDTSNNVIQILSENSASYVEKTVQLTQYNERYKLRFTLYTGSVRANGGTSTLRITNMYFT